MPLFQVAMLEVTKREKKDDEEKIVLEPTCILAKTGEVAGMKAVMDNQKKLKEVNLDDLKVIVVPFG